ncbi:head GIN domain-containing protein [Hymenobacter ruber]
MKNITATAFFCLLSTAAFAQAGPQVRNVASFHAVEVGNGIELRLTSGTTQRVVASAEEADQLDRILTEVRDGVLKISFDREWAETLGLKNVRHMRVDVTATSLTALHASSGAHAEVVGAFTTQGLDVAASSGGTVKATFISTDVNAHVSSGGVATLAGTAQRLDVGASSGGVFKGDGLVARVCDASASSGGNLSVTVQEALTADASSGGDVRYSGSPRVSKRTSSGGSVKQR